MIRRASVLLGMGVLLLLLLSCGSGIRDTPRPSQGAATIEEFVELYIGIHKEGDPERIREIDLPMAMLPENIPMNGEYRTVLKELFKLKLEDIRLAARPTGVSPRWCVTYLTPKPDGAPSVVRLLGVQDRLILIGTRPDGNRVEVDPAFGVASNGRFYLTVHIPVAKDAAQAVIEGVGPRCRPIPLGTGSEFLRELVHKDWDSANRQIDELENRIKAGQPLPP